MVQLHATSNYAPLRPITLPYLRRRPAPIGHSLHVPISKRASSEAAASAANGIGIPDTKRTEHGPVAALTLASESKNCGRARQEKARVFSTARARDAEKEAGRAEDPVHTGARVGETDKKPPSTAEDRGELSRPETNRTKYARFPFVYRFTVPLTPRFEIISVFSFRDLWGYLSLSLRVCAYL